MFGHFLCTCILLASAEGMCSMMCDVMMVEVEIAMIVSNAPLIIPSSLTAQTGGPCRPAGGSCAKLSRSCAPRFLLHPAATCFWGLLAWPVAP